MTRPVFMLTDFGTTDTYVGQVKGAIASVAPGVPVIDLTHEVAPYAIDHGAWLLETALPALPESSVILAVVDPGVGTSRRGIAIRAGRRDFVGPDNGLLSASLPTAARPQVTPPATPVPPALEVRVLDNKALHRRSIAATFHGRDIFGPVAGHLASGGNFAAVGAPTDHIAALPAFVPDAEGYAVVAHIDRYGNLITTIPGTYLTQDSAIEVGGHRAERYVTTFGDAAAGELVMHRDSSGFVAIAVTEGSAAKRLNVRRGDTVRVVAR